MFRTRDSYSKLHRRRRRQSGSRNSLLVVALLVGLACAIRFASFGSESKALPLSTQKRDVVAQLTAHDAVTNAVLLAGVRAEEPAAKPPTEPVAPTNWRDGLAVSLTGKLKKNESISLALTRRDIPDASVAGALAVLADKVNFRRSRPGDPWEIDVDERGIVTRLRYATGPLEVWEAVRGTKGYEAKQVEVGTEQRVEVVSGTIQTSLWQAFETSGADYRLAAKMADVFAYTIDFVTETQRGDRFYIAFESSWLDGKRVEIGDVVAVRYVGDVGDHRAFRWNGAYYTEKGESVERQFLRSPLATTRITSNYGRRFHPVLKTMKMHAGVDYGAPTGTPIQAVADGTVTWAGRKGANGNLIAIRHAGGYTTYYAHLSKISSKVRRGRRVKKKQVIGAVGSTGRSTGPHLHFGMKRHGAYINPLKVDFERGAPLGASERKKFRAAIADLQKRLQ